nr:hypothetical protein [Paenibacillus borealis]
MLVIWSSPGSGKTTVSVKLAQYVASCKRNVLLLLCDMTTPMLPCIPQKSIHNKFRSVHSPSAYFR